MIFNFKSGKVSNSGDKFSAWFADSDKLFIACGCIEYTLCFDKVGEILDGMMIECHEDTSLFFDNINEQFNLPRTVKGWINIFIDREKTRTIITMKAKHFNKFKNFIMEFHNG